MAVYPLHRHGGAPARGTARRALQRPAVAIARPVGCAMAAGSRSRRAATPVAPACAQRGDRAAAQNVSHMADLPDWAARLSERQSRVADAVAALAPLDRLPRPWLIRLLQAVGLVGLLALGLLANSTFAWAVIAIPMTMIVVLVLEEESGSPGRPRRSEPGPDPLTCRRWGRRWSSLRSIPRSRSRGAANPRGRRHSSFAVHADRTPASPRADGACTFRRVAGSGRAGHRAVDAVAIGGGRRPRRPPGLLP